MYLDVLLREAGAAAMSWFGRGGVRLKADASPVTDADLAAEAVLIEGLRRVWPDDTIISEECGVLPGGSGAVWYVDPIDGTSAFTEGLAHFGPTVARVTEGPGGRRIVLGATRLPRLDEGYHVESGVGWWNGARLPPLAARSPSRVVYLPSGFHRTYLLDYPGKGRCLGGTAAHLALVARGAAGAVIVPPAWSLWDTAAGLALIDDLGGRAVRLPDGAPLDPFRDEGVPFLAGFDEVVMDLLAPGRIFAVPSPGLSPPAGSRTEAHPLPPLPGARNAGP